MALWGKTADVALTGTGSIDENTNIIVGTGTLFTAEVSVRDVIDLDDSRFVVLSVTDDEELVVAPISDALIEDAEILSSTPPKYLSLDDALNNVVLVETADAQDANNRVLGVKTPGWNKVKQYTDQNGNPRNKVETLVVFKS